MKLAAAAFTLLALAGCAATPTSIPRSFAIRLHPGDDLRQALERITRDRHLKAAYIATCAGSLNQIAIRFADQERSQVIKGPFEIVSLVGTLSPDGPHLHISVSDNQGRTIGGHLTEGSIVHTTAEIVVANVPGVRFAREIDAKTTFRELVILSTP